MILDYIKYLFKSKDEHSLHSPFVFDFYTKILKAKSLDSDYEGIETLREKLLRDNRIININDFGAGAKTNKSIQRTVSDIARKSLKKPSLAQFFYRIIKYYQYSTILSGVYKKNMRIVALFLMIFIGQKKCRMLGLKFKIMNQFV